VLLTVYGQIILKWQVGLRPEMISNGMSTKSLMLLLTNPWVISAFCAAFGASVFWMAALAKIPLSKAYPFTALSFPLVALSATFFFREHMDAYKIGGTALIMLGVAILSRTSA
jgi:drug/metabolite transporter (DMT)-like permease